MTQRASRLKVQVKDEESNIYVDANFTDYKTRPGAVARVFPFASSTQSSAHIASTFEMTVEKQLLPYFKDLIALGPVHDTLTKKLTVFFNRNEEHCTFNYWSGMSLTGKTTLAKRLSGQEGFSMLSIKGSKTLYYDCFSIKDNWGDLRADWADKSKTPNNSIIFIDDVERCLDENHKLVDEVFAQKFRKLLEDLNRTRKLFFVFLSQEKPSRVNVQRLFHTKITSLMDFDLKFPEWTTENLLNIILETVDSRGYKIEPQAAAELASHSIRHGMVLELIGVLQLLDVELRRSGKSIITESQVLTILKARS